MTTRVDHDVAVALCDEGVERDAVAADGSMDLADLDGTVVEIEGTISEIVEPSESQEA